MDEKMKVLEMLSQGIITPSEANELLKTLEKGNENEVEPTKVSYENKQVLPEKSNKKLRIKIASSDGDNVNIALPLRTIQAMGAAGLKKTISKTDNDAVDEVDFDAIFSAIQEGVSGDIVDITSSDGDIVKITIE